MSHVRNKRFPDRRRSVAMMGITAIFALLLGNVSAPVQAAPAPQAPAQAGTDGPQPGDIFREYVYTGTRPFYECDPGSNADLALCGDPNRVDAKARDINGVDIQNASKAEVAVSYWGGHLGTSQQRFAINDGRPLGDPAINWIPLAQPQNTSSGKPECYYRTVLGRSVSVPLSSLAQGKNSLRFTAGPQICYGFQFEDGGYGYYGIYDFLIRVYYKNNTPHPTGQITSPADGGTIGDNPTITANAAAPAGRSIKQVDFIGYYTDFDWDGDGRFTQWQYALEKGVLTRNLGTATSAPYSITWNNEWIPDQDQPIKIAARITDNTGMSYVTPAVTVNFKRVGTRSVKMYTSTDYVNPEATSGDLKLGVSEDFGIRAGDQRVATIDIGNPPPTARRARIILPTWAGKPDENETKPDTDAIKLNDFTIAKPYGFANLYAFAQRDVPLTAIKRGANSFTIASGRDGHRLEINWPGPALLVVYGNSGSRISLPLVRR
jgi:hypothetical protein